MDLQQRKLTKSEWDSIEKPIADAEIEILNLITNGYNNVNIRYNKNNNLLKFLKLEKSDHLEDYLFQKYYMTRIQKINKKYTKNSEINTIIASHLRSKELSKQTLKKALVIRTQRFTPEIIENEELLENTLFELLEDLISKVNSHTETKSGSWNYEYYTLFKLLHINIGANKHLHAIIQSILEHLEEKKSITHIIEHAAEYVEQNKTLLKYTDMSLFEHQKRVFTAAKNEHPKLILYTAPTGTGKTLTPLGLLGNHRVIFVCAARHVGLALAKAAINLQKKVAFAFGCETADDIRLHYFAAKDYTKNTKTGGIWKVDNSVGNKVELIICDVKSYLPAMYYMLSFNVKDTLITYWDEPTITLDYDVHDCHEIIQKNWKENLIPNMVLSSATLPKIHELTNTVSDFKSKFSDPDTTVYNVTSYECRKSVPLVNKYGYIVSPHGIHSDYDKLQTLLTHCEENPVLMRYFDVNDITKCIITAHENNYTHKRLERYFISLDDITLVNIKTYYLDMLKHISRGVWGGLYLTLYEKRKKIVEEKPSTPAGFRKIKSLESTTTIWKSKEGQPISRIKSEVAVGQSINEPFGSYITTKDAHTLTNGPTIYLSDEPEKIAKFAIQQAEIPEAIINNLLKAIDYNNTINDKISKLEKKLDDLVSKETSSNDDTKSGKGGSEKKTGRLLDIDNHGSISKLKQEIDEFKKLIKTTQLNDTFVPNKQAHIEKWASEKSTSQSFTSSISEDTVVKIMSMNDVSNSWKILLLMGIGVFINHKSVAYLELMKQLADEQKLYLIIANSDYVYGTNYSFTHGYISKSMNLTQEKIIQAIGRIGRNGIQQKYTVRLRDDEHIHKLFTTEENKPEVRNMNRLFSNTD